MSRKRGIELQVVLLPELHDLVDYPLGAQYAKVLDFLRQNDIRALDLAPFFRNGTLEHSGYSHPDRATTTLLLLDGRLLLLCVVHTCAEQENQAPADDHSN